MERRHFLFVFQRPKGSSPLVQIQIVLSPYLAQCLGYKWANFGCSGSNVAAMETSVRMGPDNRGFILRGKKSWVINAGKADYFIVVAKHEGLGQTIHNPDASVEQQRAAVMFCPCAIVSSPIFNCCMNRKSNKVAVCQPSLYQRKLPA